MLRFKILAVMCLGLLASCGFSEPGGAAAEVVSHQRLSITTAASSLELVPTAISFDQQRVYTRSTPQLVKVHNSGTSTLKITSLYIDSPFELVSPPATPFVLQPGTSQELWVVFSPTWEGPVTGRLVVETSDPAVPSAVVDLFGTGVRPHLMLDPPQFAFGDQRVGTSSAPQVVRVYNVGTGPITFMDLAISGMEFVLVNRPPMPFRLEAGMVLDLEVVFSPTVEGPVAGTLTLMTDDPEWSSVSVPLSGTGVRPNLAVSPTALDFGEQRVDTSSTMNVTVSNTGTGSITITGLSITGAVSFSVSPSMPFTLAAGESRWLSVTFSPTSEGRFEGTLTFTTDDMDWPSVSIPLAGTGVKPVLALSPTELHFGEQRVGTRREMSVTVSNRGTGHLLITGLSTEGSPDFVLFAPPATPFMLAPNESQVLTVMFSPTVEGWMSGTLTVTTDDPAMSHATVSLSGAGVRPNLVVSPTALDFGEQRVNMDTRTMSVTVSNTGSSPITITGLSIEGTGATGFSVSPTTPFTLAAGASQELWVTFSPTSEGLYTGTLTFTTDDMDWPSVSIPLAGTGVRPSLVVSTTSLDFGHQKVGSSTSFTVAVTNAGTGTLHVNVPAITSGTPFSVTPSGPFELSPGASHELTVTFSPTTSGTASATLTLDSNAVNGPVTVSLTGSTASAQLQLDRTAIAFGDVRVGSQSVRAPVTVTNTGSADATVQGLAVEGPFGTVLPPGVTLPLKVAAGGSFTFEVFFAPTVEGAAAGLVSLHNDTASSVLQVSLSGKGTIAAVATSVSSLDFGKQRVMSTSNPQPVVITNTGSGSLEISELVLSNVVFALSSPPPLPMQLAPGEQKVIHVNFTPSTLGQVMGKLYIISNAHTPATPVDLTGVGADGQLGLTPSSVSFAGVEVGTTGTKQQVVLSNVGDYPLTLVKVTPPAETSFSISGLEPGLVLNPGQSWSFSVTFAPRVRGYLSGTIVIESDARLNPTFNLQVSGTGLAPAVELLPQNLHFGKSNVGVPVTQSLTIKNVGEKDLYVSHFAFENPPSDTSGAALDFSVDGAAGFPLVVAPGQSTSVQLKFTPRAVGLRQAWVIVSTNDKNVEVGLQGEGTSPVQHLSPPSLAFGNVLVGTHSSPLSLSLTNRGTGPLTLSSMMLGGVDTAAFTLTHPTLPFTLQPGGSTEVVVTFTPDAERSFSAQLLMGSNDPEAPSVVVPLSGAGVRPQVQLSESLLEFGQQLLLHTSSPRTVRVINNGPGNVTLTTVAVEGAGAWQFSVAKPPLPHVLAPGQEVALGVTFTPQAEAEVSSTLKITLTELSQPLEVGLHGKGILKVLSIQPSPLDFGGVRVGGGTREQPLTLTNLSSETIVLAAPEVTHATGELFLFDGASLQGRTLEPHQSLIVPVGYQPLVESLSETTLSFGTTTPSAPHAVAVQLKGRAMKRLLSTDLEALDFGFVDVNAEGQSKVVTVTNASSQQQRVVVRLKDPEGSPFTLDTKALVEPLPAGGSATFTVTFDPQERGEAYNEVQVWLQGMTEPEVLVLVTGKGRAQMPGESSAGCACGATEAGSAGMLALLALVGLGSRRRRRG